MKDIKYSAIILSLVLVLSILPIVIADDETFQESDVIGSDSVEIVEDLSDDIDAAEIQEILDEENMPADKDILRITQLTYGRGFIVKDDESNADVFRGLWIADRIVEDTETTDAASAQATTRKFGYAMLGAGERHEKFKLEMTDFTEEEVSFNLLDQNGSVVGTMKLKPKKYTYIKLWFGTLTIDSGNYAGTWSVSAIANTKIVKPKIEKPARWNIFAIGQRRKAEVQEQIQERLLEKEGLSEDEIAQIKEDAQNTKEEVKAEIRLNREKRIEDMPRVQAAIANKIKANAAGADTESEDSE